MSKIAVLRSGGQSGADRGAMDAALACGVPVVGWCPAGGWAEDYPDPPGVLALYQGMVETPLADTVQRTEWNIRDSTCCIVFRTASAGVSPGTDVGYKFYELYGIPYFEFELDAEGLYDAQLAAAVEWLDSLEDEQIDLSVGGPRASEYPGMYDVAYRVVKAFLELRA